MGKENTESKILKILLKQFSITWTVTSLSNEIKISRVGIWKVLKKLEKEGLIVLTQIGQGKTSAFSVNLNWENPILEKRLSLILTEEALKNQRWLNNFNELENKIEFLISCIDNKEMKIILVNAMNKYLKQLEEKLVILTLYLDPRYQSLVKIETDNA